MCMIENRDLNDGNLKKFMSSQTQMFTSQTCFVVFNLYEMMYLVMKLDSEAMKSLKVY